MQSDNNTYVYILIAFGAFLVFSAYYWFQWQKTTVVVAKKKKGTDVVPSEQDPVTRRISRMYVPTETGHRTGTRRVFVTNKGLRVYETNEQGLPLPNSR